MSLDTLHKGALALTRATHEYYKLGHNVSIPVIDAQDYDLVIEKLGKFESVQCKYTNQKRGNNSAFYIELRSIKTNTKETKITHRGQYDLLFVMCSNGDCYSIPAKLLGKNSVTLSEKYISYKIGSD